MKISNPLGVVVANIFLKGLLGLVILLVVVIAAGLGYRAWRQHQTAQITAIRTPNGIDEARFIKVGGQDQWITIRGQDRSNPVLLMLDGGPGAAGSPFVPSPWEKDFVVVEWDQPGAGKTFAKAGQKIDPSIGMDTMIQDAIEVAEYTRGHLHKTKIGLMASSWGTFFGIPVVKKRPDLFYAYVGTGQDVNFQHGEALNYQHVLAKAHARGDAKAIAELEKSGPPPYRSDAAFRMQRKWAEAYEIGPSNASLISIMVYSPRYSLGDVSAWFGGFLASQDHFFGKTMNGPAVSHDAYALGPDFALPMFVFQGTQDDYTPFDEARNYMAWIHAPQKEFVAAEGAGHYAAATHSGELRKLMLERVRPLGLAAEPPAPPARP